MYNKAVIYLLYSGFRWGSLGYGGLLHGSWCKKGWKPHF